MDAVTDRTIHAGHATPESAWRDCAAVQHAPPVSLDALVPASARAVVVAPHPDDEVLAVGGLMHQLARAGRALWVIAVTDGDASHPGSLRWPAARLAATRAQEQAEALARLGATQALLHRLGIPDGQVRAQKSVLVQALRALLVPQDVVFTTWRLDGHPDHEAVGNACAEAARACGARLVEVPVWGWHWSRPADAPMPWTHARRLMLDAQALAAKHHALEAFQTQWQPDPSTGAAPILDAATRQRAARPFELLFVDTEGLP